MSLLVGALQITLSYSFPEAHPDFNDSSSAAE